MISSKNKECSKPVRFKVLVGKNDNTWVQMFRTLITGVAAFLLDMLVLWVLTEYMGLYYLVSAAVSALAGGLFSFAMNSFWVFHKRERKNTLLRFLVFTLIGALGLGVNLFVMWLCTDIAGIYYMLSKICAQVVSFLFNFFLRKFFVFEGGVDNLSQKKFVFL